jgi:prevent-host-death family protein
MEMPAAQFRVRFFEILDELNMTNTEIVITKHGRPVARVLPIRSPRRPLLGCMKGTGQMHGDLVPPALPSIDEWTDGTAR